MAKKMFIDTSHPEETRIAVLGEEGILESFQNELRGHEPLKGNIYLAKITRVEPSLQAAFVDYGSKKQGFLAFNEIHPDYYRIPVGDRKSEEADKGQGADEEDAEEGDKTIEDLGGDDADEEVRNKSLKKRSSSFSRYKIQEVIKRGQILLVQVIKEERGNKGAALSSYVSLAGRYCVLMPNSPSQGGISRRISDPESRKKMRDILQSLKAGKGMAVILRTAGIQKTKTEIQRDYKYLVELWNTIREKTLESTAPALIHEEAQLIRRAIRDFYDKDIDEILVSTPESFQEARKFMKIMSSSHLRRVKLYKDQEKAPLFQKYGVENQIQAIYSPVIPLPSGGYIVIQQTEALVSIDVNSGRATRERDIEETALSTNLEAANEIARQLRLRDMAGLVVVDFIDMVENRHNYHLEQKFKEALNFDRARIQMGRVTTFGLIELSRQRLSVSVFESSTNPCPLCSGTGHLMSNTAFILSALRILEQEAIKKTGAVLLLKLPVESLTYLLNERRENIIRIEENHKVKVRVEPTDKQEWRFQLFKVAELDDKEVRELPQPELIYDSSNNELLAVGKRVKASGKQIQMRGRRRPEEASGEKNGRRTRSNNSRTDERSKVQSGPGRGRRPYGRGRDTRPKEDEAREMESRNAETQTAEAQNAEAQNAEIQGGQVEQDEPKQKQRTVRRRRQARSFETASSDGGEGKKQGWLSRII